MAQPVTNLQKLPTQTHITGFETPCLTEEGLVSMLFYIERGRFGGRATHYLTFKPELIRALRNALSVLVEQDLSEVTHER